MFGNHLCRKFDVTGQIFGSASFQVSFRVVAVETRCVR